MSLDTVQNLIREVEDFKIDTSSDLENFRLKFLSKKGLIGEVFSLMKTIAPQERKQFGQQVNLLKQNAEEKFESFKLQFEEKTEQQQLIDITLPGEPLESGAMHPLSIIRNRIIEIFGAIGFTVSDGPEIEDDWHNFSALNFTEDHPARDMQDTFFVQKNPDLALRTHTSSVQVRIMENNKPPIRTISPGRVYRNEAISARAHCFFHQVEGLYIDKDVSFADLKQTLLYFAKEMFGTDTKIRLRPSYFPFTEPSAEMDISCTFCKGEGCNICKYTGWVEILGCGMVDPAVLDNCKIDHQEYSGFAFGMGIERITMLVYDINDLRIFSENDVRFLKQFKGIG
ncbi:MAG TPA: phenylalanine--tRNA ligase subunit alpha [Bacteroidia bacterium]|nr:MAG: phenylalanyl-tRNA synthetase subunit alpha [Bacteroidetes bacterium OLB10]MBX3105782.1 phenylalanine--tRNA ligase subunit alpha [Bacteroidota bacterium]MCB8929556.1 phenylalanine--tRNA ligase subunit alpha [Bacteroidia bacterium]OQB63541.1 MAG: Phenylalanine--tRNA ligase alpha subunit [Bacteroidetes bacterium ADurb.Bin141]HNR48553.1 phenylalanine--tRNA ligase subunit alpha [Bacteroidia bacterium]